MKNEDIISIVKSLAILRIGLWIIENGIENETEKESQKTPFELAKEVNPYLP